MMLQPRTRTVLALLFYCTLAKAIDHATDVPLYTSLSESSSPVSDWGMEGHSRRSSQDLMSSITTVSVTDHYVTTPLSTHIQYETYKEESYVMLSDTWSSNTMGTIKSTVTSDQWSWSGQNSQPISYPSFSEMYKSSIFLPDLTASKAKPDNLSLSSSIRSTIVDSTQTLTTKVSSSTLRSDIIQTKPESSKTPYPTFETKTLKKSSLNPYTLLTTDSTRLNPTTVTDAAFSSTSRTNSLLVTTGSPDPNEGQYFVAFKSDDCPKIKVNKFDHELTRALGALGVLNVTANIARTKCRTQLNINITATGPLSAIKLLEQSKKRNITITVFNRIFKIIDIQQLNGAAITESEVVNSTTTVITAVRKNEFNAYVAVGTCFGLVLLVCVSVCCIKCFGKDPDKRSTSLRNSHSPLNAEDYTLTPLPRPTSLYVDYYRNSFSPDVRSTASNSIASTSPSVEKVVQPFDTSIVPLEDFVVATISDGSRRNSVESTATQKSYNHLPGANPRLLYLNSMTDSREKLNPKFMTNAQVASGGISNPTYQRY